MYRYSNSFGGGGMAAPAPRNSWEQAERILEILERDPIQPPDTPHRAEPYPAAASAPGIAPTPIAARIDEWLRKPLRESNYLRGMGIAPNDPFWDTHDDPRLGYGGPPPELAGPGFAQAPASLPVWQSDDWPHPLPLPKPGDYVWRTWNFNPEQHGDRPLETLLRGTEPPPAASSPPDTSDYGYGIPVPPPPAPETAALTPDEDQPPRIVAVVPHRNDREIADEIWAKLSAEQGGSRSDSQPEQNYGIGNLFGLIGSAQAQARGGSGRRYTEPMPQGRAELYSLMQRRLLAAEPSNPFLTTIQPRGYVPNEQEINTLWREMAEAEARAASGQTPRPQGYLGPMPRQRGGETEYTIAGRVGHGEKQQELEELGYRTERPLESGRRIDAVRTHEDSAHIKEIKSDNPRGIARAQRQAESYAREYEAETKLPTSWELELYNVLEVLKRLLPKN